MYVRPLSETVSHGQVVVVFELKKIYSEPSPKVDLEIPLEPVAPLGLLWSVLHTPGRLQQSSLCADVPGQSKTRLALLLHFTIPR